MNKNKQFFAAAVIMAAAFTASPLKAQVTIGELAKPDGNAVLDLRSNTKLGLLLPRLALKATNDASPMTAPVTAGIVVYNTATAGTSPNNVVPRFYYNDGTKWILISDAAAGWLLTGNANTGSANFIGTTDNQPLRFKTNNVNAGIIGNGSDASNAIGYLALNANIVTGNNAFGTNALATNTTGDLNNAFGNYSLTGNTTGDLNNAFGNYSLNGNTTGSGNNAFGIAALRYIRTGNANSAFGNVALEGPSSGIGNASASSNSAFGTNALQKDSIGNNNSAFGAWVLNKITSGNDNTAVGTNAGINLTTGSGNTAVGMNAGINLTTGSYNIAIGNNAALPSATADYQLNIGTIIQGTNIGTATNSATNPGRIGIGTGTTAPASTLDVNGSVRVRKLPTGTTTANGIIIPVMTLTELNAQRANYTDNDVGAMVYISTIGTAPISGYSDQVTCIGVITWGGTAAGWLSSCAAPKTYVTVVSQPKAFTFYEEGTESPVALTFGAGGSSALTFRWYKVVGMNINVRVGTPCVAGDAVDGVVNSSNFIPKVIKGYTGDARNTGFYKYYCVAKNATGDSIISNIAEVAVGCGAKDLNGQWVSFMCFNLGADPQSMAAQKSTTIPLSVNTAAGALANTFTRSATERTLLGDLFQWGRIADGHEIRDRIALGGTGGNTTTDNIVAYGATTYANGNPVGPDNQPYPQQQIGTNNTTYYGKFIRPTATTDFNWYGGNQAEADQLWRESAFAPNDPCTHIMPYDATKSTTYSTFWPAASPNLSDGQSGTGWRLPTQSEWASLYRGGLVSGNASVAYANTWSWYQLNSSVTEGAKGMELKPDGVTPTLFLTMGGYRNAGDGFLFRTGAYAYYWSSSLSGANAYATFITSSVVYPSATLTRGTGASIRCVKN